PAALWGFWAGHARVSFWLAYMHLLLMLCPNTKFLTPSAALDLTGAETLPANTSKFQRRPLENPTTKTLQIQNQTLTTP
ncbi:hypothetical protein, partial [Pseudomonas sp. USTB-Z]|uniref:hypothetical protein n=1 Tax=Pseudomonas sp. USTB-Z TaxID=2794351 RepID=UPI001C834A05